MDGKAFAEAVEERGEKGARAPRASPRGTAPQHEKGMRSHSHATALRCGRTPEPRLHCSSISVDGWHGTTLHPLPSHLLQRPDRAPTLARRPLASPVAPSLFSSPTAASVTRPPSVLHPLPSPDESTARKRPFRAASCPFSALGVAIDARRERDGRALFEELRRSPRRRPHGLGQGSRG